MKLEDVHFGHNEIEFSEANMFDYLLNLNKVDLEGYVCVNKSYDKENFCTRRSDLKKKLLCCSDTCIKTHMFSKFFKKNHYEYSNTLGRT